MGSKVTPLNFRGLSYTQTLAPNPHELETHYNKHSLALFRGQKGTLTSLVPRSSGSITGEYRFSAPSTAANKPTAKRKEHLKKNWTKNSHPQMKLLGKINGSRTKKALIDPMLNTF